MVKKKELILIVGGTGFIGFHLINFLKKKRFNIVSLSTRRPKIRRTVKGVKYVIGDISNKKNLNKLNSFQVDYIINLGGFVDHTNKKKTFSSHYHGVKNLSDFFINSQIKSFIQLSSGGEYGKIKSPHKENYSYKKKSSSTYYYAKSLATKLLIKLYKKKKFPVTILRLYQAYGPNQDINRFLPFLIINCLKNKKFPTSNGKQYRDFIYISDLVTIIYKCLNNKKAKGQIINVGSGKAYNIKKIILKVMKICKGGKPDFGKISLRKDENLFTYPDIKKLKKIISFSPKISFERGVRKTIRFYKN